jgi:hypothetical protein
MTDPFRTLAIRRRIIAGVLLLLVAALIVAVSYLDFGMPITNGHEVQAQVLGVGTRPRDGRVLAVRLWPQSRPLFSAAGRRVGKLKQSSRQTEEKSVRDSCSEAYFALLCPQWAENRL